MKDNRAARVIALAPEAEDAGIETRIFPRVPCTTVPWTGIIDDVPDAAHTVKTVVRSSKQEDSISGL